ncbi:hypothetical protein I79_025657 [Cricetulus griseus]|uniref:Uncharacterized protein n=1 Tax=Cricetulus griseus TaxID=10029 RepID=G3INW4_CRIGR|nr:hypothetical protein I79_025657 [Cricetulus griseus]
MRFYPRLQAVPALGEVAHLTAQSINAVPQFYIPWREDRIGLVYARDHTLLKEEKEPLKPEALV